MEYAGWTSSNPGNQFYHSYNVWGDHYWIIDLEMDCSATREGWFELETLFSNGGEGGEGEVSQQPCDGGVGGTAPVHAGYHSGRCGYMNIFHYNSDKCTIENIPQ